MPCDFTFTTLPGSDILLVIIDHGELESGTSTSAVIDVDNVGDADLVIGSVALADPLVAPFGIITDGCSAQSVAPAGSCSLTVEYAPAASGAFQDGFDIPSNDAATPSVTVDVSGTADSVRVILGGAFGLFGRCDNVTTAQFETTLLGGANTLNCTALGLATSPGDTLRITLGARRNGGALLGGIAAFFTPQFVHRLPIRRCQDHS